MGSEWVRNGFGIDTEWIRNVFGKGSESVRKGCGKWAENVRFGPWPILLKATGVRATPKKEPGLGRPADYAADGRQGTADIHVLRRFRVRLERYPASYTRWRHPPFPRRWREPPRRIRCVQTARPSVTISSQPFCPVSPPGCLRACLGSLRLVASWVIGACRSRGGGNRAYSADIAR
jgi:hypothetical protein